MSSSFLVSGFGVTISKRNSVTVGEETQAKNIVEARFNLSKYRRSISAF